MARRVSSSRIFGGFSRTTVTPPQSSRSSQWLPCLPDMAANSFHDSLLGVSNFVYSQGQINNTFLVTVHDTYASLLVSDRSPHSLVIAEVEGENAGRKISVSSQHHCHLCLGCG